MRCQTKFICNVDLSFDLFFALTLRSISIKDKKQIEFNIFVNFQRVHVEFEAFGEFNNVNTVQCNTSARMFLLLQVIKLLIIFQKICMIIGVFLYTFFESFVEVVLHYIFFYKQVPNQTHVLNMSSL